MVHVAYQNMGGSWVIQERREKFKFSLEKRGNLVDCRKQKNQVKKRLGGKYLEEIKVRIQLISICAPYCMETCNECTNRYISTCNISGSIYV